MDRIPLTKEEAVSIARFVDNKVHCFANSNFGLLGCNYSKEEFEKCLDNSQVIEIGSEMCRKMKHAIIVIENRKAYFFENRDEALEELLISKEPMNRITR